MHIVSDTSFRVRLLKLLEHRVLHHVRQVPAELGHLSSLRDLRLSANRLTGPIPPELGNLAGVWVVWLDGNELEGPIPPELRGMQSLTTLYLGDNRLSGEIPPRSGP